MLFVTTARTSEWAAHLSQRYESSSVQYDLIRFGHEDYNSLIERIIEYVPAPKFIQLSHDQRRRRLRKSSGQLLVALREATESKTFDEIISDEFDNVPKGCAVDLFVIVGLATIARVGIRAEMVVEAMSHRYTPNEIQKAFIDLSGIVYELGTGRFFVRHELYVRRIFSADISFDKKIDSAIDLIKTYTKYQLPVVRNTSRPDGVLFRFVLNRDFIRDQASSRQEEEYGRRIFEEFEVPFQLDGHFWLQYGLYVADLGNAQEGVEKLEKSLQAFPGNTYAQHALASLRLRYAANRPIYDSVTRKLIDDAVGTLRELVPIQHQEDHYPLVTLALRHTGVLVSHGRINEARAMASNYLSEVQRAERGSSNAALAVVKEALVRFLALGSWDPPNLRKDW